MEKRRKKQQGMWDILIPILLVIAVLPWIVHLAVYSCGYAEYEWYSVNDMITDFYCYYKSYFLDITAIFAFIILLFRMGLYREKTKNMKWYIPLGIYGIFVVASTVFSVNTQASLQGNFESFESCLVLLSYVIMSVYAYQVMEYERDYRIIWFAVFGISIFFLIIGMFQVFGCDLMNFTWVQRILMSKENFDLYGGEIEDTFSGNNLYLTLYNPNYAGIVLNMLFAVVLVMCVTEVRKKKKTVYGILSLLLAVLTWYTYSRASLLTIVLTVVLTAFFQWKSQKGKIAARKIFYAVFGGILLVTLLVILDAGEDFKYLSRMIEQNTREPLESMITDEEGIHIRYDEKSYLLWMESKQVYCKNEEEGTAETAKEGEELALPMEKGAKAMYLMEEQPEILLYIADTTLTFVQEDNCYYYKNESGKLCSMIPIEAADFHGLEYLGSARGYIWSRVLPMLKQYLFIGSGPDTFAEVFPQNDYAGKIVYSDRPDMIIEKAHNDYLTKWVQTGMISVVCILVFYICFIQKGAKIYFNQNMEDMRFRIGFGCYLACISYMFANLFNDSTLQTSPLFWVFAGIALSSSEICIDRTNRRK